MAAQIIYVTPQNNFFKFSINLKSKVQGLNQRHCAVSFSNHPCLELVQHRTTKNVAGDVKHQRHVLIEKSLKHFINTHYSPNSKYLIFNLNLQGNLNLDYRSMIYQVLLHQNPSFRESIVLFV